jgi:Tat protein translocase TatB subunit
MFDIGFQEMVLIMVLALIVFGPSKLPELGKMIGRAMREFRKASDEFRSTVETNLKLNEVDAEPARIGGSVWGGGTTDAVSSTPADPIAAARAQEHVPAGAESSAPSSTVVTETAVDGQPYWAQRGSRLFHRRDCAWAARIAEADRVPFETVAAASSQGYATCPVCEPWESR